MTQVAWFHMVSDGYVIAKWAEYVFAVIAGLALGAGSMRLARRSGQHVLAPAVIFVLAGALCLGSIFFLRTRVQQLRLDSIKEVGLEIGHAGLRTNALRYQTQVSVTVSLRAPGVLGHLTSYLVHKTTQVNTEVAVYGLINFATVKSEVATVDRQARTITLSLPDPSIGPNTTYIAAINGIQEKEGPLTALAGGFAGVIGSIFHLPVVSVNPRPELALAEARALNDARHNAALESCGKEQVAAQLNGIFHLVPAYRGYTVVVKWPVSPSPDINCASMQREFLRTGS